MSFVKLSQFIVENAVRVNQNKLGFRETCTFLSTGEVWMFHCTSGNSIYRKLPRTWVAYVFHLTNMISYSERLKGLHFTTETCCREWLCLLTFPSTPAKRLRCDQVLSTTFLTMSARWRDCEGRIPPRP